MQLPIFSGIWVLHNIKSQPRFLAVARQPSCFGISELTKMAEKFTPIRKEKAEQLWLNWTEQTQENAKNISDEYHLLFEK